jgi:hypothetical protein
MTEVMPTEADVTTQEDSLVNQGTLKASVVSVHETNICMHVSCQTAVKNENGIHKLHHGWNFTIFQKRTLAETFITVFVVNDVNF